MFGQFFVDPDDGEFEDVFGAGGVKVEPDPVELLDGAVVGELVAASATRAPPVMRPPDSALTARTLRSRMDMAT